MSARFTLVIANKNYSSWSLRPWMVLKQFKIPFDEKQIILRQDDTAKNLSDHSPSGRVPVLIDKERNIVIWESLAICEYLAEEFQSRHLWPQSSLHRAYARSICCEMVSGFMDLRNYLPMDLSVYEKKTDVPPTAQKNIDRIFSAWGNALEISGGPYLFGDFSIADAMYTPVITRFKSYGINIPTLLQSYVDRMWESKHLTEWRESAKKESYSFEFINR